MATPKPTPTTTGVELTLLLPGGQIFTLRGDAVQIGGSSQLIMRPRELRFVAELTRLVTEFDKGYRHDSQKEP